jgi:hypothetical protein
MIADLSASTPALQHTHGSAPSGDPQTALTRFINGDNERETMSNVSG